MLAGACHTLLNFPFKNIASRSLESHDTLIENIAAGIERWEKLQHGTVDIGLKSNTIDLVYSITRGEDIGVQNREKVCILEAQLIHRCPVIEDRDTQETVNIFSAINHLKALHGVDQVLLSIEQHLLKTHEILLHNINSDIGGKISSARRFTTLNGKIKEYPAIACKSTGEHLLQIIIDRYNVHAENIRLEMSDPHRCRAKTADLVARLVKLAAWLMWEVLALHPFADGNGRLARLLASYSLTLIAPFFTPFDSGCREEYLKAITAINKDQAHRPSELAALLLESYSRAWQNFFVQIS